MFNPSIFHYGLYRRPLFWLERYHLREQLLEVLEHRECLVCFSRYFMLQPKCILLTINQERVVFVVGCSVLEWQFVEEKGKKCDSHAKNVDFEGIVRFLMFR